MYFMIKNIMNYDIIREKDHKTIIEYLDIGISIPVLPEFEKYILETFKNYNVQAFFIRNKEVNNYEGMFITFNEDPTTLFFGFFRAYDHDKEKINILLDRLIEYSFENDYKIIRGPVNIPAVIFGFGFMVEGSNKSNWIGKPVNPPLYQNQFIKKGFYIKYTKDSYKTKTPYYDLKKIGIDFSEYEYINPTKKNLDKYLPIMIKLHEENMDSSNFITPNPSKFVKVLFDYIFEQGSDYMVWVVKYKPTNRIIATGHIAPNPFEENSGSFEHYVIDKDHQGKGLAVFMYIKTKELAKESMLTGSGSYDPENEKIISFIEKYMYGVRNRRHIILEYDILKKKGFETKELKLIRE
jgi:hypothetical protein